MPDDLSLLQIDVATLFVISPSERIERTKDPDGSPAPRLFFAGCPQGNIVRVRHDLAEETAQRLLAIAQTEPPWWNPWALPQCIGKLIDVLSNDRPSTNLATSVIYQLPNHLKSEHSATIVRGDSAEGAALRARFAEHGMPPAMVDAGFTGVGDLWEPWCVALEGGEVASIAFAARLGEQGVEIGVYTFPKFRARGYAAAVTAEWSSMPGLEERALFYSTSRANRSSQHVASRLGLRMFAASFGIG
jgi:hypothetical protein